MVKPEYRIGGTGGSFTPTHQGLEYCTVVVHLTANIGPTPAQCFTNVTVVCKALGQHWANVLCLITISAVLRMRG